MQPRVETGKCHKFGGRSPQKGALRGTAVVACLLFAATRATALARLSIFFLANREESMLSEVSVLGGLLDGEKVES